jgi:uncharacterized protein YndB with AHSA1/START domain
MTQHATLQSYGVLSEPTTLTIERLLPGPIERIWGYLTKSDLRSQWLAAGEMEMKVGSSVELVWHNDELTDPPGRRPANFPAKDRMECKITEVDPPHRLAITWGSTGGVSFDLKEQGKDVLLTLVHHRIPDRSILLNVSAGWHMHLDILVARTNGERPQPFWDGWAALKKEYDRRLPA